MRAPIAAAALLALSACVTAPPPAPAPDLAVGTWQALELAGGLRPPTLRIEGGTAVGFAGCNRYSAAYLTGGEGAALFGAARVTRMACPPPQLRLEQAFLARLQAARAATPDGGAIVLRDGAGAALLRLTPAGAADGDR